MHVFAFCTVIDLKKHHVTCNELFNRHTWSRFISLAVVTLIVYFNILSKENGLMMFYFSNKKISLTSAIGEFAEIFTIAEMSKG